MVWTASPLVPAWVSTAKVAASARIASARISAKISTPRVIKVALRVAGVLAAFVVIRTLRLLIGSTNVRRRIVRTLGLLIRPCHVCVGIARLLGIVVVVVDQGLLRASTKAAIAAAHAAMQ
jgi:hypothetical protein